MTTSITPSQSSLPILRTSSARKYARKSKSDRTIELYGIYWREFMAFAKACSESPLPAEPGLVIDYLSTLADQRASVSTIEGKRAAIAWRHRVTGMTDPTIHEGVRAIMSGIRRELGVAPVKKAPATLEEIRRMVADLPDTLAGRRDRALLLVGFGGGFRRSELVALDVADVRFRNGMSIVVRRSKTDQEGQGVVKFYDALSERVVCPVFSLRGWLDAAGITSGAIFRRFNRWGLTTKRMSDQSVALIVKSAALRAGLDPRQFSGHSLRSGFITEAYNSGARERDIMQQTGHKSERSMRGYIRDAGAGARSAMRAAFNAHELD